MKELLDYLVKSLVSQPDQVEITENVSGNNIDLSLKVAPEDMGMIIGKHGKIIGSIRQLVRLKGHMEEKSVNLNLVETEKPQAEE